MTAKQLMAELNIGYYPEIEPYYLRAVELYLTRGKRVVDTDRIKKFNAEYNFLRKYEEEVCDAADMIAKDEAMLLFVYTLVALFEKNKGPECDIGGRHIVYTELPDRERLDTDMAPLFAFFWFLDDMIADFYRRGVPKQVVSDTLWGMETEMDDYLNMFGRIGMRRYVDWYFCFLRRFILRVGRFQFVMRPYRGPARIYRKGDEYAALMDNIMMHRTNIPLGSFGAEDEDGSYLAQIKEEGGNIIGYAADERGRCNGEITILSGYTEFLRAGEMIVEIHIPSEGGFSPEICRASYAEARRIIDECYPDYGAKAFVCHTWMMQTSLYDIMGKETNITRFQGDFVKYPLQSQGNGIYPFVYNLKGKAPAETLPENTSMQRGIKKYLLSGHTFYEMGGVLREI